MAQLHNRVSNKELKQKLYEEAFDRTTISFYQYFTIQDPAKFRDDMYQALNAMQVFGRIYIATEGINAQISVPTHLFEVFKTYLSDIRAMGIDMETATIFTVGFVNKIPHGALLLVSDNPMTPDGVKTEKSDHTVTTNFVNKHLQIGIDSLEELANSGESVKHLRFE